jgi:hypothetical protein
MQGALFACPLLHLIRIMLLRYVNNNNIIMDMCISIIALSRYNKLVLFATCNYIR